MDVDMEALEAVGGVKLDILGLSLLDKIMGVSEILEYVDIQIEKGTTLPK